MLSDTPIFYFVSTNVFVVFKFPNLPLFYLGCIVQNAFKNEHSIVFMTFQLELSAD